jgi:hypothetical protein
MPWKIYPPKYIFITYYDAFPACLALSGIELNIFGCSSPTTIDVCSHIPFFNKSTLMGIFGTITKDNK